MVEGILIIDDESQRRKIEALAIYDWAKVVDIPLELMSERDFAYRLLIAEKLLAGESVDISLYMKELGADDEESVANGAYGSAVYIVDDMLKHSHS